MITRRHILLVPLVLASARAFGGPMRLSYEESCHRLQKAGHLDEGPIPPLPDRLPQYDDPEPLGVNFFRTRLENDRLEDMTLPRTFFGHSEIGRVSFKNTDLSQSNLCWNDFVDVDFTSASLESSDLRASAFSNVRFDHADLAKVDLRRSTFQECTFAGASLTGAVAHERQKPELALSDAQAQQVSWTDDDGEVPAGG